MRHFAKVKLVFADGREELVTLLERTEGFTVLVESGERGVGITSEAHEDPDFELWWAQCCVCREQKVLKRPGVSTLPGPICRTCKKQCEAQG